MFEAFAASLRNRSNQSNRTDFSRPGVRGKISRVENDGNSGLSASLDHE
jgi:hypothetical protein